MFPYLILLIFLRINLLVILLLEMGSKLSKSNKLPKKVKTRDEYLTCIPFDKLQSRPAVAITLSYYGESQDVYTLM